MRTYRLDGKKISLSFTEKEGGITFCGTFGGITVPESGGLFSLVIRKEGGESVPVDAVSGWQQVSVKEEQSGLTFSFASLPEAPYLSVKLSARLFENGVDWNLSADPGESTIYLTRLNYPALCAPATEAFYPGEGGTLLQEADRKEVQWFYPYPSHRCTMQYLALFCGEEGIYYGLEDPAAWLKMLRLECRGGLTSLSADITPEGAGTGGHPATLPGRCRWEYFAGDWYDAAQCYRRFVLSSAPWRAEAGRPDIDEDFRRIPFWICDYIPNSPAQGDNRPMKLSAGSDRYEKGYWVDAAIRLQKELGVPVAYHVYNWHEIPFNVEYPHFLPAKEEFIEGAKKLRENGIKVVPYINAMSWDSQDALGGHEVNYENTGSCEAVIKENGKVASKVYPQITRGGTQADLCHICPSSEKWHEIITSLTEEMLETLPIDGVYFDQCACTISDPCFAAEHRHLPGGGDFWVKGLREMMERLRKVKKPGSFYFTEGNAEPFCDLMDGYLTWLWVQPGEVPAFSAVYAGQTTLIGRCVLGKKKEDGDFFRYSLCRSLLYGQQLGWYKADLIYDEKRLAYAKKCAALRYEWTEFFFGTMLRPPKVATPVAPKTTSPGLEFFKEDIVIPPVEAAAWQARDGKEILLLLACDRDEAVPFTLSFDWAEFGVLPQDLPQGFEEKDGKAVFSGVAEPEAVLFWRIKKGK